MARLADATPTPRGSFVAATLADDLRGAVYVEFLFAFVPVFLLFLSICQLALIASAKLVVEHAALAAVRTAIVVLEERPKDYDDAARGSLSSGRPNLQQSADQVLRVLHLTGVGDARPAPGHGASEQQGARMTPIRAAAYLPLLVLAPREEPPLPRSKPTLAQGVSGGFETHMAFALEYSRAASSVSVHSQPEIDELAHEPISATAPVTVRVNYLFQCAVPLVRSLICRSLATLLAPEEHTLWGNRAQASAGRQPMKLSEAPGRLAQLAGEDARFVLLTGEATLPNQGAHYYARESD